MSDDEAIKRAAIERLHPSLREMLPPDFDFELPPATWEASESEQMRAERLGLDSSTCTVDRALGYELTRLRRSEFADRLPEDAVTRMAADLSWPAVRTLADMGELTARWLEGLDHTYPSYNGPIDPETAPVAAELAAINRLGFVTDFSQPGMYGDDHCQRAAVSGFCTPEVAESLARGCAASVLIALDFAPSWTDDLFIPVTLIDGEPLTFGRQRNDDDYIALCFEGTHPDGVRSLQEAYQVLVVDPAWGRNDMLWWIVLDVLTHGERGL